MPAKAWCIRAPLLRLCNLALRENVVLPPWIHTGSKVANFAAARVGDELSVRARVAANYERKGHRLVDLDTIVIANGRTVRRPRAAHGRLSAAPARLRTRAAHACLVADHALPKRWATPAHYLCMHSLAAALGAAKTGEHSGT